MGASLSPHEQIQSCSAFHMYVLSGQVSKEPWLVHLFIRKLRLVRPPALSRRSRAGAGRSGGGAGAAAARAVAGGRGAVTAHLLSWESHPRTYFCSAPRLGVRSLRRARLHPSLSPMAGVLCDGLPTARVRVAVLPGPSSLLRLLYDCPANVTAWALGKVCAHAAAAQPPHNLLARLPPA